jgi:hypothetical protein
MIVNPDSWISNVLDIEEYKTKHDKAWLDQVEFLDQPRGTYKHSADSLKARGFKGVYFKDKKNVPKPD